MSSIWNSDPSRLQGIAQQKVLLEFLSIRHEKEFHQKHGRPGMGEVAVVVMGYLTSLRPEICEIFCWIPAILSWILRPVCAHLLTSWDLGLLLRESVSCNSFSFFLF